MINRTIKIFLLFAVTAAFFWGRSLEPTSHNRSFHFQYEVSIASIHNAGASVKLWVPVPQSGPFQTISNLKIDGSAKITTDVEPKYGNTIAHLSEKNFQTSGVDLTISFDVNRKEQGIRAATLNQDEITRNLEPVSKVPRDTRFDEIAKSIISPKRSVIENGRLLYDFVLDHMAYEKSGFGWGQGDAVYACDVGTGNCTDYHSLFNAVARTANIPARFLIGFPVPDETDGLIPGYHCWTEFYAPEKGWIPVDISEAEKHPENENYLFGHLDPNRVLFTTGRDIELVPAAQGGPVNFFIYPVLEIDGVRSNDYSTKFSYTSIN